MDTITETAEHIDDAIHQLFGMAPARAKPFAKVIISLIEHLRSRLDTVWFYPLGKMDATVERLKGFIGEAGTGRSPEDDLQLAFSDWSLAKRNLEGMKELPRYVPDDHPLDH